MRLYEIEPTDDLAVPVVARSPDEAADLFITWSAANDRHHESFMVSDLSVDALLPKQQEVVRNALAAGLVGVLHFLDDVGWTFSPPMSQPDDRASPGRADERHPLMRIFEMRDLTPIEAFVLAVDHERALELFAWHLQVHGGNADTVLFREVALEHMEEPANDAVNEALDVGWDGLVTSGAHGWMFVTPLGVHRD
jgi:hypothetical protein